MRAVLALVVLATMAAATDRSFVAQAMTDTTSEIRQGDIFADSADPLVQAFAHRMTTTGSEANTALIALAHRMHVSTANQLPSFPYTSGVTHPAWMTPQIKASIIAGSTQRAFFKQQIRAANQAIVIYRREIDSGKDTAVVSYARHTLPKIERELDLAQTDLRMETTKHHG